jgi:hypothetical protein
MRRAMDWGAAAAAGSYLGCSFAMTSSCFSYSTNNQRSNPAPFKHIFTSAVHLLVK